MLMELQPSSSSRRAVTVASGVVSFLSPYTESWTGHRVGAQHLFLDGFLVDLERLGIFFAFGLCIAQQEDAA